MDGVRVGDYQIAPRDETVSCPEVGVFGVVDQFVGLVVDDSVDQLFFVAK
jgi:hypothetical protein